MCFVYYHQKILTYLFKFWIKTHTTKYISGDHWTISIIYKCFDGNNKNGLLHADIITFKKLSEN